MSELVVKGPEPGKKAKTLIYVVDDEAMLLELACVILEPLGYEVRTFRDPAAALKAFTSARQKPSLLITDYAMQNMDGLALLQACREVAPGQKILLISGTVGPEICRDARAKPDRFLGKPYQARELVELVRSMLQN